MQRNLQARIYSLNYFSKCCNTHFTFNILCTITFVFPSYIFTFLIYLYFLNFTKIIVTRIMEGALYISFNFISKKNKITDDEDRRDTTCSF